MLHLNTQTTTKRRNNMEELTKTIEKFLEILRTHQGANPKFSIDYQKNRILVHYAPSSFIKLLASSEKGLVSLSEEGLSFQSFR